MKEALLGGLILAVIMLGIRLWRYRRQIAHLLDQMSLLEQEDTNYRLSSYCSVGRTEELIDEINRIRQLDRERTLALRKGNRSYRESIIGISHDIRTPLTSAKGYMQMLLGDTVPDEKKRKLYIEKVEHRIDDVVGLLDQLFEYARVEADEIVFEIERINLCNIFANSLSLFYDDFAEKGCEPVVKISQSPCYIKADRNALKRITDNLIKNALVHGKGDYRFAVEEIKDRVEITVSNLTDSIEESDLEHIFDRFYTTDQSRTRKITGLGLTIVKRFAEKMGGNVSADLKDGVFSIKVTFPAA